MALRCTRSSTQRRLSLTTFANRVRRSLRSLTELLACGSQHRSLNIALENEEEPPRWAAQFQCEPGGDRRSLRSLTEFLGSASERRRSKNEESRSKRSGSIFVRNRRRPTLPGRIRPSTIGATGLNFCVRNGNRCDPSAITTETFTRPHQILPDLHRPGIRRVGHVVCDLCCKMSIQFSRYSERTWTFRVSTILNLRIP